MDHLSYRTKFIGKEEHQKSWYLIDADQQSLGRLCTRIASILRGKHKASFTPNSDAGDFIIVINSHKVHLTGDKWNNKVYHSYSGYPGGQKTIHAKDLHVKNPLALIETAVKGMLPKGPLGKQMFKKLFIYPGAEHPHGAQKPQTLEIK